MSFSSDIKKKIATITNECEYCNRAQLAAMVRYAGRVKEDEIVLYTENKAVAECIVEFIKNSTGISCNYEYLVKSRLYEIVIDDYLSVENICDALMLSDTDESGITPFECCLGAYIRGAFLGGGSISDPHKSYHLEFDTKYESEANRLTRILENVGISSKTTQRKNRFIVYIKEYSLIADVLSVIGASSAAFDIFNISIEKEVRNNINRQMNCENANMDKVADAYKKHLAAIEKIKKTIGLEKLPEVLQEIAKIRVMYPEDSLKELGERLEKPIGKSGVNHRLNRIVEISNNI